jgi:GNAT superfamily N-acetyltransferase
MKVYVRKISKLRNGLNAFADTIYNNFGHLSNSPQLGHNKHEIRRLLHNRDTISYVAYLDNKIIAYIVNEKKILPDGRQVMYIGYLYVSKKYRGLHLGSKLLNLTFDKAKNIGIHVIMLTCDIKDIKVLQFYQKMGFTPDPMLMNFGQHEVFMLQIN